MEGNELREQSNAIDVSEKDPAIRVSRKIDLMIFYLADVVDNTNKTKDEVNCLQKDYTAVKNKAVGAGIAGSVIMSGLVYLVNLIMGHKG